MMALSQLTSNSMWFLLVAYLKDEVYKTNPHTMNKPKQNITNEIRNITVAEFNRDHQNVISWYKSIQLKEGDISNIYKVSFIYILRSGGNIWKWQAKLLRCETPPAQ